jgi:HD-GYP domain-containing protein (c-di-GMP phosphodiesterase class II)
MISDRPYRKARSHEEALAEVERCSGTQFDPQVAETLLRL